jgi:hypothetical protein
MSRLTKAYVSDPSPPYLRGKLDWEKGSVPLEEVRRNREPASVGGQPKKQNPRQMRISGAPKQVSFSFFLIMSLEELFLSPV